MEALIRDIEEAHVRRDDQAKGLQLRWLRFGFFAAVLGPGALLFLAIQVLIFPERGWAAVTLILFELLLLSAALAVGFLQVGDAHVGWVDERLRAELLRREGFLLRAGVGPYLEAEGADPAVFVNQRLLRLDSDLEEPLSLVALASPGRGSWSHELEDAQRDGKLRPVPDLPGCIHDYLSKRVASQRKWFSERVGFHERRDRWLENGAKIVLTAALIVAAIHLGMLIPQDRASHDQASSVSPPHTEGLPPTPHSKGATYLVLAALVLPPLGAACVGLRALLEGRRISRSYGHYARALGEIERELAGLQLAGPASEHEVAFRFQRLVLQTEELLAAELRQWWFVMHPSVPTAEA
jgi:hypothetical protein